MFRNVYPREKYLSRIRPFYDSDIIKVITGIRRCGKSFILRGIINELLAIGKPEESIVYVPLDQRGFKSIKTPDQLESKIESMMNADHSHYLFIDEVQNVSGQMMDKKDSIDKGDNYSSITIYNDEEYYRIAYVDNTLLYAKGPKANQYIVDDVFKKAGY